jgi:probable O-glycosylation ligase (exosortase A-associated)
MPYRDVLLTLVLAGLVPAALVRPWIGILGWYWIGMMNPHLLTWSFARQIPVAMLVAIPTLIGLLLTRDRKGIAWNRELIIVALMFVHFTVTSFFAWSPSAAWAQWDKVWKILLMTYVTTILIYGRQRIWVLVLVIVFSIGYYGFKGGIFTFMTGGVHKIMGPGGSFLGTNVGVGVALVMVIPLLVFMARDETRPWLKTLLRVTAGLSVISAAFTYSRGAMLGLAAILPFVFLKTKRKALALIVLLPLVYYGKDLIPKELYERTETIAEYQQDTSAQARLMSWSVAWNVALEKPLTGAGFNFEYSGQDERWLSYASYLIPIKEEQYARAAHSIYFQVLGQHGFVGLGLFVALLASLLWSTWRIRRAAIVDPETVWMANLADAIRIGVFGYVVAGAFVSMAYFDLLYVMVALVALLQRELSERQREAAHQLAAQRRAPPPVGEAAGKA